MAKIHYITSEGAIDECNDIEYILKKTDYIVWAIFKNTINETGYEFLPRL
jgi:hypothetical protein